jgi:hypothetical protein
VADIDVCVRILIVDDEGKICVEFSNTNENNNKFNEHYNDIVNNVLNFSNNAHHQVDIYKIDEVSEHQEDDHMFTTV